MRCRCRPRTRPPRRRTGGPRRWTRHRTPRRNAATKKFRGRPRDGAGSGGHMITARNFAYGLVTTPPSPAASGTTLTLAAGHGARFPTTFPFPATIWPPTAMPDPANAEIVSVTAIAGNVLTIVRAQESTVARTLLVGDQVAAALTAAQLLTVP